MLISLDYIPLFSCLSELFCQVNRKQQVHQCNAEACCCRWGHTRANSSTCSWNMTRPQRAWAHLSACLGAYYEARLGYMHLSPCILLKF